jgi:hypothetical protein
VLHGRSQTPALISLAEELNAVAVTCDGSDRQAVFTAREEAGLRDDIDARWLLQMLPRTPQQRRR